MWNQLANNTNISKPVLTKVASEMGHSTQSPTYYRILTAPNFGTNRLNVFRTVNISVQLCTTYLNLLGKSHTCWQQLSECHTLGVSTNKQQTCGIAFHIATGVSCFKITLIIVNNKWTEQSHTWARMAWLVLRLAAEEMVCVSDHGGCETFRPLSRPTSGTTQPPIQWVPALFSGGKAMRLKKECSYTSTPLWAFKASISVKLYRLL